MVERGVGVRLATAADTRAVGRLLYDVTTEFDTPTPSHLGQGPWPRWVLYAEPGTGSRMLCHRKELDGAEVLASDCPGSNT